MAVDLEPLFERSGAGNFSLQAPLPSRPPAAAKNFSIRVTQWGSPDAWMKASRDSVIWRKRGKCELIRSQEGESASGLV